MSHNKEYDNLVPSAIFDVEDSDEIAEMYLDMNFSNDIVNPCMDCGVEVDDLDNEYCDKCWNDWKAEFKKATGYEPELITI